jgi:hypothetical protein
MGEPTCRLLVAAKRFLLPSPTRGEGEEAESAANFTNCLRGEVGHELQTHSCLLDGCADRIRLRRALSFCAGGVQRYQRGKGIAAQRQLSRQRNAAARRRQSDHSNALRRGRLQRRQRLREAVRSPRRWRRNRSAGGQAVQLGFAVTGDSICRSPASALPLSPWLERSR